MAKVTDIQDKNGVSKEIQDKDLANRTSQSTVASTDYILLEDTDGAYHKIAKASFTEAVRGALGSVINSVAKGTDIAKVPVLDSNNDLGMGTLANLASVLGEIRKDTPTDDLNNIPKKECKYEGYGSLTNAPWKTNNPYILNVESIPNSGSWLTKQTITNGETGKSYYRVYSSIGDSGWSEWKEI